jgi:uncharacterized protein (TIRG00374 family)
MKVPRWQLIISSLLSLTILAVVIVKRHEILSALALARNAEPFWLGAAVALTLFGFFCTSLVYDVGLRALGRRAGNALWLWGVTIVCLIVSQSIPAGGVAGYTFLARQLQRKGVPGGEAGLLASLEAVSFVAAMVLMFCYALVYLTVRSGIGAAEDISLAAGLIALAVIGVAVFLLTRSHGALLRWMLALKDAVARVLRIDISDEPIHRVVAEVANGRNMVAARPWLLGLLVVCQLLGQIVQSMAMWLVLYSLGVVVSPQVVIASFGVVLITSMFNALPGGGGTVEAALALMLQGLGVGAEAIPASVIFRLINYWMMLPVAGLAYVLVTRGGPVAAAAPEPEASVE